MHIVVALILVPLTASCTTQQAAPARAAVTAVGAGTGRTAVAWVFAAPATLVAAVVTVVADAVAVIATITVVRHSTVTFCPTQWKTQLGQPGLARQPQSIVDVIFFIRSLHSDVLTFLSTRRCPYKYRYYHFLDLHGEE